jgi:hypothetical protein
MSALPAQITEQHRGPEFVAVPVRQPDSRAHLRAERRAAQRAERQSRRNWAIGSCVLLGASFALTVGILEVFH